MNKNPESNKKRKLIATVSACGLAGALLIGGTFAYLTDTDKATNTFTVGKVTIDTLEPNYPGNGSDKVTDIVPNEEIPKDPQIKNTGKNSAVVFERVDIPMAKVTPVQDDGTRLGKKNIELFKFKNTKDDYNSVDAKWILLSESYVDKDGNAVDEADAAFARRTYGYESVLKEGETTTPIFSTVKLANFIEDEIDEETLNINLTSYAIQADNIAGISKDDFDDTMKQDTLNSIYKVYVNQSGTEAEKDADTKNHETLKDSTMNLSLFVDNNHLRLNTGKDEDKEAKATVKIAYTGTGTAPSKATYASSDESVATIDADGNITAKKVGKTIITATVTNPDDNSTKKASVTIEVVDYNTPETSTTSSTGATTSSTPATHQ